MTGPDGPLDAELCIVGRDPGWQEIRDGKPFVGASGHLLDEALQSASLKRADVLVTNVVGERPAGDDWEKHTDATIAAGHTALWKLLRQHPRKVVLTLGTQAMLAVRASTPPPRLEDKCTKEMYGQYGGSITEVRGYSFHGPSFTHLPSIHPAYITRSWLPWRACLNWDVQKAARLLKQAPPTRKSRYVKSLLEARMLATQLSEAARLAVDIEQDSAGQIACVAFAANASEGYALDMRHNADVVRELLALPCPKIFMNGQYDTTMLKRAGIPARNWTDDIMVMWHALEPLVAGKAESGAKQTQKSLRFLASVFCDEPWWKDYDFQSYEDKLMLCATDARVTYEVWERLRERLDA